MSCYVKSYNIHYVMLYSICSEYVIQHNRTCYMTYVMLCYMTYVRNMFYHMCHVMLCYITYVLLCYITYFRTQHVI